MKQSWAIACLLTFVAAGAAEAEVKISGLIDFLGRNNADDFTNITFRETSNLDMLRSRVFLDANVSDGVDFFGQVLVSGYSDIFVYGAYVRFNEIGPAGLQVGLIPSTIGNWGARTYSDRNPLVGVPLVQNHHSSLNPRADQSTVELLLASRDERTRAGLPVLYDNCWNTGAELYGQQGPVDWSLGVLAGSATAPRRDQEKDLPQVTSRVAWWVTSTLQIAANGWAGPYLYEGLAAVENSDPDDYLNAGYGADLYATFRWLEFHGEFYRALWEHPTLPDLWATSGYLDAKYKFRPGWYVAARGGFFEPGRVQDSVGVEHAWDYPVRRLEWGVGHRPVPRVVVKVVTQHNRFQGAGALDTDHYLLQLSAGF